IPPNAAPFGAIPFGAIPADDDPSIAPPMVEIVTDGEYFTRYTLFQEGDEYSTTNYTRGSLVPINTPVKVVSIAKNKVTLKRLDTGDKLTVENEEKYTRKNAAQFAQLMLSSEPTPLEQLPPHLASAIKSGTMRKGMTREQVLMARGYPPAHETPSLDSDRWVYWSSRFVRHTIVFFDGRLAEGRGIF
ncbi:MAG TPA: hypothetical protein VHF69_02205, partial [Candidatus Synoicihabitans sp.]|nr:hypothetical protein [Candidatus Synoicihabitans sp.]